MIVEDNRANLTVLSGIIGKLPNCIVEGFDGSAKALARALQTNFDLILVDYLMPDMNGIELINSLRRLPSYQLVPIVMVTAASERQVRLRAIEAGATDFLNKPIDPVELKARVRNLLALRQAQNQVEQRAELLTAEVEAATRHLTEREEELIWRLARAMEYRDGGTGDHISRVARISQLIAEGLGQDRSFSRTLYLAAPLHDVGKIGVPDAILSKPGRLTDEEMTVMREHVNIGAHILEHGSSELIRVAAKIASTHHERWDGKGYPKGLAGTQIPLEGRITAVADVFDALCSERPYKPSWPLEDAYQEIVRNAGSQFDPACVAAFQIKWPEITDLMDSALNKAA
jgi:putative two-component system response regulator